MCGITGLVHPHHKINITAMTDIIAHRGPDDYGYFTDEYISLGHRRLSIQDLSNNGHQPMFTSDRRFAIVYNGEIYNHVDLRKKLEPKYTFRSTSDTETLLYGYVEYGTAVFAMLNGIFALAIYDTTTHDLVVVRDPFGVKPLYYYHDDLTFVFGSEIKAILTIPDINKELDAKGLFQYLRFLWSPGERTPLARVKKLLPGHYLKINSQNPQAFTILNYYNLPFTGQYEVRTEEEWINALDEQLRRTVQQQLLSDVPVGFFLSGGLDSSMIAAIAKKVLPEVKLRCYTVDAGKKDMADEGFSEDIFYARLVAKHLGAELIEVPGMVNIMDHFGQMIWHLDEPQADVAPLHVYNICKKAREDGYVVLLGGAAGDDVFSGYRRHQALYFEKYIALIPVFMARLVKISFKLWPSNKPVIRRIKKLLVDIEKSPLDRLLGYFSWISLKSAKKLLSEKLARLVGDFDTLELFTRSLNNIPGEKDPVNRMLYLELKYFLPDHNLNYTDKLSMACGVEVRVPFLDKDLVEFSTRIPPSLKMKGTTTKYLLRKVAERYLPQEVINRPKAGFGAPVRSWIKEHLNEFITRSFNKDQTEKEGLFIYESVQELLRKTRQKKYDGSYTILSLMAIRSWYHQFIEKEAS